MFARTRNGAVSVAGSAFVIAVWFAATDLTNTIDSLVFPGPVSVYQNFVEFQSIIISNILPTLQSAVVGFLAAVVAAVLIAVVLLYDDGIKEGLMPILVGTNSVPRVTLAPLIIFYIGGTPARYIIAAWVAFFPIFLSVVDGLEQIEEDEANLLRLLNTSYLQELRYFRLPNALPLIFDGLKTGIVFATVGAVVGEFVGAGGGSGIGYLALAALQSNNLSIAFSIVGVMGIISALAFFALLVAQDRIIHWQETSIFPE
jgi:NitT/TauT family transport system permease protein